MADRSEYTANREGFTFSHALPETGELYNERKADRATGTEGTAPAYADINDSSTWELINE